MFDLDKDNHDTSDEIMGGSIKESKDDGEEPIQGKIYQFDIIFSLIMHTLSRMEPICVGFNNEAKSLMSFVMKNYQIQKERACFILRIFHAKKEVSVFKTNLEKQQEFI